jgi:hypothetical protein
MVLLLTALYELVYGVSAADTANSRRVYRFPCGYGACSPPMAMAM